MSTEGLLESEIARRTRKGWEVVSRQASETQMRKRKHFSFLWAVFWLIFGLGIGFVCYLLWHWAKRDRLAYLRVENGRLLVSEQKGLLSTLWTPVASYWGWAGRRTSAWGKGLAYAGPAAVVVVLVVIISAASASGGGSEKEKAGLGAQPTSNTGTAKAPLNTPEPATSKNIVKAAPGAAAEAENVRVTLNQIVDPWVSDNQFIQPDAGKRFVAFDVTIENTGKSGTHDANPFNFKLTDAQSFAYETSFLGPDPALHDTDLGSGEKTRGWVPFEVNQDASLGVLKYDPNIFTTNDIEFQFQ